MTEIRGEDSASSTDRQHEEQSRESPEPKTVSIEVQTFPPGLIVWDRQ